MNERIFMVTGYKPVDKDVNAFIKACDLGVEGMFYWFSERVIVSLREDTTRDQYDATEGALIHAYERVGCTGITVHEVN